MNRSSPRRQRAKRVRDAFLVLRGQFGGLSEPGKTDTERNRFAIAM